MAAGQGFKTFTTGEVLTAGDVNGYLMQGINVFTNATARDAAITAPAEGQFAFTKDNNSLWYYDGAAWVASGATGDIEGVTAGVGISGGGTSGTVTVTNSMATAMTTKGDMVVATGSGTFIRQAVGTDNQVLMAASAEADGVKYANEATATLTTTGDTLYASAANTLARRAIGTTGQVLTVSGGLPTWATPAAGGGMTLLSTTSMSGSTTTVSSINQTYKKLVVYLKDFYPSGSTAQMALYMNGFNSGNSYFGGQWGARGSTSFNVQGMSNNSGFDMTAGFSNYLLNSQTNNFAVVTFEDYANTDSRKIVTWQIGANNDAGTVVNAFGIGTNYGDIFQSAISSISFNTNSGSWSAGSILIYGVS